MIIFQSIVYLLCDNIISIDSLLLNDIISIDYLLCDSIIPIDSLLCDHGIISLDQPAQHEVGGSQGTVQCQPQINVLGPHTGNIQPKHNIFQLKIGRFVL